MGIGYFHLPMIWLIFFVQLNLIISQRSINIIEPQKDIFWDFDSIHNVKFNYPLGNNTPENVNFYFSLYSNLNIKILDLGSKTMMVNSEKDVLIFPLSIKFHEQIQSSPSVLITVQGNTVQGVSSDFMIKKSYFEY